MTNSSVAMDYAKIFFQTCEELKIQTEVLYQTKKLQKMTKSQTAEMLRLPTINIDQKIELLNTLKEGNIHEVIINLLKVLVQRNDFKYFDQIVDEYQKVYQERYNILIVHVTTANKLSSSNFDLIVKKLEKKLNKMVVLLSKVDKEVIGGIKIEYNSKEVDNTIKKHLREFVSQI